MVCSLYFIKVKTRSLFIWDVTQSKIGSQLPTFRENVSAPSPLGLLNP
jgi:hypothetical protein